MKEKSTLWQRMGLQSWFLNDEDTPLKEVEKTLTPNDVYKYIIEKFRQSIGELSFANRVVFYHEFIICFNPADYREFMDNKKGIFGLIVHESVKEFYNILKQYRTEQKTVEPSSSKWVFRFVSHPDYARGDKSFIGKLLPGNNQKEENLKVTFIPRQTGIAQTFDINQEILKAFTFYSEGYYEVPYVEDLDYDEKKISQVPQTALARFETILPGKEYIGRKVEYLMKDQDIIVTGAEDQRVDSSIFKIPSEWVNTPHLYIRLNKADGKFYLASFGEKTIVNEKEVERSDINSPVWVDLPINSKILLNGIIGVNIFKSS
ncbi:MAG TPA: hypothetical protein VLZ28_08985 [Daejeonella sp.]|nr:hypothetical protein [Daejeonella sp.]